MQALNAQGITRLCIIWLVQDWSNAYGYMKELSEKGASTRSGDCSLSPTPDLGQATKATIAAGYIVLYCA